MLLYKLQDGSLCSPASGLCLGDIDPGRQHGQVCIAEIIAYSDYGDLLPPAVNAGYDDNGITGIGTGECQALMTIGE